jgi:endonuclease/exonuclease/phosphatase (EEP) superfamily protein YafD
VGTRGVPHGRRGAGDWLRLVVGGLAALAGMAAAVGIAVGHVGGERWSFERIADLRPQFLLLAVVALVGLLAARWWRWAVGIGVVALVAAWTVAPLWLRSPAPPRPGSDELRIASINLSRRGDVGELARHLTRHQPADVVIVVESNRDVDERFRRGDTGYEVAFPRPGEANTQTTVLTRVPVAVGGAVVLNPDRTARAVELDVELDGEVVHVLGAHPRSPRGPTRAAVRNQELRVIADWVERQSGPTVVIGDLNVTRWAPMFGVVTSEVGLVDSAVGYGLQPTWELEGTRFAFPIDHLLHSPSVTTTSRRIGPSFGSDHSMVLATLTRAED